MKDRQEMIEKGKTLFKSKSTASDEIEVWKESSLKYQTKYQESVSINQEIKLLLESCLAAKESLIKDLAAANELIFQKDLKNDSRPVSIASKATQTISMAESRVVQTNPEILTKQKPQLSKSLMADSTVAFTQTGNALEPTESIENLENSKSQLAHIRDAYERAQTQMQLLGDANAQLKVDLENEKKISALLEGRN